MPSARAEQRKKVLALMAKPQKRSKYRAVRCEVDGETFDSKREMREWLKLKALERRSAIRNLKRQVRYPLEVNGVIVATYVSDFEWDQGFTSLMNVAHIVADSKGVRTRDYILKRKLMKAIHGIEIREL